MLVLVCLLVTLQIITDVRKSNMAREREKLGVYRCLGAWILGDAGDNEGDGGNKEEENNHGCKPEAAHGVLRAHERELKARLV